MSASARPAADDLDEPAEPAVVVLATPPLLDRFVVPLDDGEPIVLTPAGTPVPVQHLPRVRTAAAASRLALREHP